MRTSKLLFPCFFACACACAMAANFPLGTYLYAGSALNYKHEVLGADSELTVLAVNSNGVPLASCAVCDSGSDGVNFALQIPISTTATDKSAAVGDTLRCVTVSSSGATNVAVTALPPIASSCAITNVTLVVSSASAYPYKEGGTVWVADDYVAGISYLMEDAGYGAYSAIADWDGDGQDNYSEYVAGTNPFDPSDHLRIVEFKPDKTSSLLSFEYSGGHLYTLSSATNLAEAAQWKRDSFSTSPDGAKQKSVTVSGDDDDVGTLTLYLAPAASSPAAFYKIGVE